MVIFKLCVTMRSETGHEYETNPAHHAERDGNYTFIKPSFSRTVRQFPMTPVPQ